MSARDGGPMLAPAAFVPELDRLSRAALIDLIWHCGCMATIGAGADESAVITTLRERAGVVERYRRAAARMAAPRRPMRHGGAP